MARFSFLPATLNGDLSQCDVHSLNLLDEFFLVAHLYDVDVSSLPFTWLDVSLAFERRMKNEKD